MPRSDYVPQGDGLSASSRASYRTARQLERDGEGAAALAVFHKLCGAHPERLAFHLHRLQLARALKGTDYAAGLYVKPPPGVTDERAETLRELAVLPEDNVAGRKGVLEVALAHEPDEPFWHLGLADVEASALEYAVERAERERALGRVQASEAARAEALRLLESARTHAQTALDLAPDLVEARLMLGYLCARRGELVVSPDGRHLCLENSQRHLRAAVAGDPASVAAHVNLAEIEIQLGNFGAARRSLKAARLLASENPLVWNNLGYLYYRTGRESRAVECYETSLELEPGQARTRAALGDGLRAVGRFDDAVRELRRARDDAAEDRELRAEIAFKLGAIFEFQREYREAIRAYKEHVQLRGADSSKAESRIRWIYGHAYE